ncbi:Nse1 non-SMC component of SMC5-6 complex-domain-containing protein [Scheffersomyces xylosifermentans]|uniref:Nse1 non-SMC component of SMC5-6 complex-domain-containing protein n=1 Tax=Scheffersomyces xylosifermentans TaxID=1304137 RepID=UPI00315D9669
MSSVTTEIDRIVLTYIRSVKYISHDELLRSFKLIKSRSETDNEVQEEGIDPLQWESLLDKSLSTINTNISRHGFKIDRKKDEISGELYFIFINTVSDDIIKQNTNYSVPELDAIKSVIDDIVEASGYQFSIGRVNAQQRVAANLSRTLRDSSSFVDKLIDDGWFISTLDGTRLLLSIKSLSELKNYLIDRYGTTADEGNRGKMHLCHHCKEIVTLGYTSTRDGHIQSFHYKCYDVYIRSSGSKPDPDQMLTQIGIDPSAISGTVSQNFIDTRSQLNSSNAVML